MKSCRMKTRMANHNNKLIHETEIFVHKIWIVHFILSRTPNKYHSICNASLTRIQDQEKFVINDKSYSTALVTGAVPWRPGSPFLAIPANNFLISAIALPGFSPLGQVLVQFMMVWHLEISWIIIGFQNQIDDIVQWLMWYEKGPFHLTCHKQNKLLKLSSFINQCPPFWPISNFYKA